MSQTAAERLAAKAAAAAARNTPAAPVDDNPLAVDNEKLGVNTKPVRSTVDLSPVRHAQLKAWCGETAVMLGKSRVTTQDVVRAMVDRLVTDETFARKVREDLQKGG